jgi:hypothetical protein
MSDRSGPNPTPQRAARHGKGRAADGALTEDLVRKVADKVYAMLMQDLMVERERHRPSSRTMGARGGW